MKSKIRLLRVPGLALIPLTVVGIAQVGSDSGPGIPVATQWALDAAGPIQRNSVKSVMMMVCPVTQKKGTAFYLTSGFVVTNEHVVHGCAVADLRGHLPTGTEVHFKTIMVDAVRDLAVLRPTEKLAGGLELGSDTTLRIGSTVTTWGFPLIYNGPAPLLSVGYVAGFNAVNTPVPTGERIVKHIVVNGAFNPGNSGGPVFASNESKVIGVVVWKQRIVSQTVPTVINGFRAPGGVTTNGRFSLTRPDGTTQPVSDQEAIAAVLVLLR